MEGEGEGVYNIRKIPRGVEKSRFWSDVLYGWALNYTQFQQYPNGKILDFKLKLGNFETVP